MPLVGKQSGVAQGDRAAGPSCFACPPRLVVELTLLWSGLLTAPPKGPKVSRKTGLEYGCRLFT